MKLKNDKKNLNKFFFNRKIKFKKLIIIIINLLLVAIIKVNHQIHYHLMKQLILIIIS